jgi:primosomal protein N' (replication factor Y) (superfamily II helicase)
MHRFVRVAIESNLLQLDREFDFLVPDALADKVQFGQRVRVELGRSKKQQTGFIIGLPAQSEFATTEISELVGQPSLTPEIYEFAGLVAKRQCVAIGEILGLAVPDHMPRIEVPDLAATAELIEPTPPQLDSALGQRSALLTSTRSFEFQGKRFPDWSLVLLSAAIDKLKQGKSAIVIVPEQDQINLLRELSGLAGIQNAVALGGTQKKADRFRAHQQILSAESALVIGTRTAIYAPAKNLGLLALFDDLDDSLREQGSPFTHARELALMRPGNHQLVLAANYRSLEVQRLVEIGYLSDHSVIAPAPRITFSEPGSRLDAAAFALIRERVESGVVLALLPRKGSSAAAYCANCDEKIRCSHCGSSVWEPAPGKFSCRLCSRVSTSCHSCRGSKFRQGRTGSTRTTAELGKSFPGALITEVTADRKPSKIAPKSQVVVATPGSAPRIPGGYAALIVLDTDIWLSSQSLRAEQLALRDWQEAIELLAPDGRALLVGLRPDLGQAISLQQHRELAKQALGDLNALGLPPATRIASIEGTAAAIQAALAAVLPLGATEIRTELGEAASTTIKFGYSAGSEISQALRRIALETNARIVGGNKRRGLRIVMDDVGAL